MSLSQSGGGRRSLPEDGPGLEPGVLRRIERALARVGDFGEVRLIVVKGHLRFIETVQSESLVEQIRRLDAGREG